MLYDTFITTFTCDRLIVHYRRAFYWWAFISLNFAHSVDALVVLHSGDVSGNWYTIRAAICLIEWWNAALCKRGDDRSWALSIMSWFNHLIKMCYGAEHIIYVLLHIFLEKMKRNICFNHKSRHIIIPNRKLDLISLYHKKCCID